MGESAGREEWRALGDVVGVGGEKEGWGKEGGRMQGAKAGGTEMMKVRSCGDRPKELERRSCGGRLSLAGRKASGRTYEGLERRVEEDLDPLNVRRLVEDLLERVDGERSEEHTSELQSQ